jgi:hypothetical protein
VALVVGIDHVAEPEPFTGSDPLAFLAGIGQHSQVAQQRRMIALVSTLDAPCQCVQADIGLRMQAPKQRPVRHR